MHASEVLSSTSDSNPEIAVGSLLHTITKSLDDDQVEDLQIIELEGKSSIADYMIVASGRNQRHVGAVSDHLIEALKQGGFGAPMVEGLAQADWVLLDAGDIIVHIFRPEVRSFYNIEKMWTADLSDDVMN